MTAIDALPIIAGFVAIWLAAWITQPGMSSTIKRLIVFVVAGLLGVLSLIVSGQIEGLPAGAVAIISKGVVYVGLTLVASQSFYQLLRPGVKGLEEATSPPRRAIGHGD